MSAGILGQPGAGARGLRRGPSAWRDLRRPRRRSLTAGPGPGATRSPPRPTSRGAWRGRDRRSRIVRRRLRRRRRLGRVAAVVDARQPRPRAGGGARRRVSRRGSRRACRRRPRCPRSRRPSSTWRRLDTDDRPRRAPRPARRRSCCSTPGRRRATAARSSRSTRSPATSRRPATRRPTATSPTDGRFLPPSELAARFRDLGADGSERGRHVVRQRRRRRRTTRSRCAWPACPTRSSTSVRAATGRRPATRSRRARIRATRPTELIRRRSQANSQISAAMRRCARMATRERAARSRPTPRRAAARNAAGGGAARPARART